MWLSLHSAQLTRAIVALPYGQARVGQAVREGRAAYARNRRELGRQGPHMPATSRSEGERSAVQSGRRLPWPVEPYNVVRLRRAGQPRTRTIPARTGTWAKRRKREEEERV